MIKKQLLFYRCHLTSSLITIAGPPPTQDDGETSFVTTEPPATLVTSELIY